MARIKYVINERRVAYEGAVAIHEKLRISEMEYKLKRKQEMKELEEKGEAHEVIVQARRISIRNRGRARAVEMAAAGLLPTPETPIVVKSS